MTDTTTPARSTGRGKSANDGRMSLVEHLVELRNRLFKSALAVLVGVIVAFAFYRPLLELLTHPLCEVQAKRGNDCNLAFFSPLDGFLVRMRVSLFVGFVISSPVWLYQLWAFITPGLHPKEKRLALPFVGTSIALFTAGATFAYFTLSKGLEFLLGFSTDLVEPILEVNRYLSFVLLMLAAFGISFEFPLVLIFLTLVGVVDAPKLRRWRRGMYFGIAVFSAIITPSQDPFTFAAMAVPMGLFYEAAVVFARIHARRKRRRAEAEPASQWADDETSPL